MSLTKVTYSMIEGAVYSPQDYVGANAGEQIAAAIDQLPNTGGVIDARGYTGTQVIASDIFASRKKPFVLLFGKATFNVDLNSYSLTLNSNQKIVLDETTFQPSTAAPDGWTGSTGLFATNVFQTTGSIVSGSNSLVVADASNFSIGALVAVRGAEGSPFYTETTLSGDIDASTTTIPLTDASDFPATYTVYIGSEIITGTEKSGNNLINVTRGAYGSTAASHTTGDTVSNATDFRATVTGISGNTITLSGNASATVVNAVVDVGSTNISIEGTGVLDGRQIRGSAPVNNTFGIKLLLATNCHVSDGLTIKNWDHGGTYLESSWSNYVGGTYTGNADPSLSVGASIWVFRRSSFNTINPVSISDTYIGIFVDDRTSNANRYDGFCNKNTFNCSTIIAVDRCFEVTGGNGNNAYLGYVESSTSAISLAQGVQGSTLRPSNSNVVYVGEVDATAVVVRNDANYLSIGTTAATIDLYGGATPCTSMCEVHSGTSKGTYFGAAITNPTSLFKYTLNNYLKFESVDDGVTTGDVLGGMQWASADTSAPGAGIKASVRAEVLGAAGGSVSLKFGATSTANDTDSFEIAENYVSPGQDDFSSLGTASALWSEVFAATGTINTSDERQKQDIEQLSDAEKRVAVAVKGLIKKFRFKSAVERKGDNARIHVGVIAQEVKAAFEAEGLDGHRYGILCYDEWEDDDGVKHNRYGVRYEELLAFVISSI